MLLRCTARRLDRTGQDGARTERGQVLPRASLPVIAVFR